MQIDVCEPVAPLVYQRPDSKSQLRIFQVNEAPNATQVKCPTLRDAGSDHAV